MPNALGYTTRSRGRNKLVHLLTAAAALLLVASSGANAQSGRVGIGVGISDGISISDFGSLFMPTIYVPIMASDKIMIEPGLGLLRFSESDDGFEDSSTLLSLGVGILFLSSAGENDHLYVGPRLGILRASSKTTFGGDTESSSSTHLKLGGVLGGEFFLKPRLSLGGEGGIHYLSIDTDGDGDASVITTSAEFRVRWYFR